MGLVWPWSVVAPLNPFHAVEYFSNFFEKPWRELFDGQLILVPDMPRSYVPTLFALQLPELHAGARARRNDRRDFVAAGIGKPRRTRRAARGAARGRACRDAADVWSRSWRGRPCTTASAILCSDCRRFAVLGGLAAPGSRSGSSGSATSRRSTVAHWSLVAGVASPVIEMVRLHPYEYTYFNHIAGGVAGARPRYMIDYWGLSMTQASRQLRALLAQRGEKRRRDGTHWTVAVCGPHPAGRRRLGRRIRPRSGIPKALTSP